MCDVIFLLGANEERLCAHKLFLMTASPIFHKILSQESDKNDTLTIKISQITKNTMIEICRYAYTESVNLTRYNMLEILFVASKFEMRNLMEKIVDFVGKQINENSVFVILQANQQFCHWQINKKCFDFIERNHKKCLKNQNWLKLTPDLMRLILSNCKVPKSFIKEALLTWSKTQGDTFDDLKEMMDIIKLNNDDSDTESIASQTSSKAGNKGGSRRYWKNKKDVGKSPSTNVGLFLNLEGSKLLKNFKQATLDLSVMESDRIRIKEIYFVYDIFALDTEFELRILVEIKSKFVQIYYEPVKMTNNCKFHKLRGRCELHSGQKFRILIEFPHSEFRETIDGTKIASNSHQNLQLYKNPIGFSEAQIIEKISYAKI